MTSASTTEKNQGSASPDGAARAASRRLFAPEVIQTSAMDCGPAALKCLLEGFGVGVSYGRLREACQTSVDGTSIDTLEALAQSLGLDAEQIMLPADHVLAPASEALPAIVVVTLPGGLTHFIVLWRRHGPWVQVMDPARGRRWVRADSLQRELYVHTMALPADVWRAWAGSDGFLQPLQQRLGRLGLRAEAHLARACADPGWQSLASLDAAVRMIDTLMRARAVARGSDAQRLLDGVLGLEGDGDRDALLASFATATAAPATPEGEAQLWVRGAVLVRAPGLRVPDAAEATLPRELRAALDQPRDRPAAHLLRLLRRDGVLRWSALGMALCVAAAGAVFETVLFRGLFDLVAGGTSAANPDSVGAALGALAGGREGGRLLALAIAFVAAMIVLELPLATALRTAGRRLEGRLRLAFLQKIPRLGDRYFQSRPVSDMAERAHLLHRLRLLPGLGGQFLRVVAELLVTAAALSWLYPPGARLIWPLAATMIGLPLTFQPLLGERDLRVRNHAGGLGRFYLDALMGLMAIRTHRAEGACAREHHERVSAWREAARAMVRAAVTVETAQAALGFALGVWVLVDYLTAAGGAAAASGSALLVIYWSLNLPLLGQELAFVVQQYPGQRNITLRLTEPLGALEDDSQPAEGDAPAATGANTNPVAVRLEFADCVVQAGGHDILTVPSLRIEPGEHVAIVGPSGAGKSSLVGVLLGWFRPAQGEVRVDGRLLQWETLETLRRETAWVDPAVYLWNRTLPENLTFGARTALPSSLAATLEEADLVDIARRLSSEADRGDPSTLGEAGGLLSGGEGQRVRFGRAHLRPDSRLAILDEPFRGLDRAQRHRLLARARRRWAQATLLCVTHDLTETLSFPRVLVVEGGRIVEDGAPATLRARPDSRYHQLLQAEETVRRQLWSSDATVGGGRRWRRVRLQDGRLDEQPGDAG